MTTQLLLLELNEVNFEFVEAYCKRGELPHFRALIERYGYGRTTSEQRYEDLEPWIQWVTAHTGLPLAQHGVFRLGDIVERDIPQIWELLEQSGLKVGAISPMNAKHRLKDPAFFVPDPWTRTEITAPDSLRSLYRALAQAVNDNASSKVEPKSLLALLTGAAIYARMVHYPRYAALAMKSLTNPWCRASFLDLLLADVFIGEVKRTRPNFASLFLNAAAHIQHHYMYCSGVYSGINKNPAWYVAGKVDPVLEIYELYDRIIASVQRARPDARIMLATGLHQVPHEQVTFYWRLRDHAQLLRKIGVPFAEVEPRMSRDFLVKCATAEQASAAAARLAATVSSTGVPIFEVDNRGVDLFVMLTYAGDIDEDFRIRVGTQSFEEFRKDVVFVAIKNGEHNGVGYFLDTGARERSSSAEFPLARLPQVIANALGVRLPSSAAV